ncbi:MAG: DEAD/DEAH box helicase [Propionibacteriaceae bacterium]|jgi:ATP-dependent Lhr-like helicase|nr:DEAD/DEAH box helicase [Propionibacteriaceae bacterium]
MTDPLLAFSPATRAWFASALGEPTEAQRQAWAAIGSGQHTLVIAPTGSGKTLAAFLWSLDRLLAPPAPESAEPSERPETCRVLYISPLKALATDVRHNLQAPLAGIRAQAAGQELAEVKVALRTGDTPADQRRHFARHPADILVTTPESLYLLLTSQARQALTGVETVIVDEIHSLVGNKRGAHLAVSLERLDALLARPAQRIGLSATVRPVDQVTQFLAGGRPVALAAPPALKRWQLDIVGPTPDLGDLTSQSPDRPAVPVAGRPRLPSVWPDLIERLVDLIAQHRSTLVFVNSRQVAERVTARLNEVWQARGLDSAAQLEVVRAREAADLPASYIGLGQVAAPAPPVAMSHHGSLSQERRRLVEADLKAGRLRAVVATSSLELGIDMGAIDLVIQIETPLSVASGLQRVGRAGHQVGAISHGVLFPKHPGDLVSLTVVAERMRRGQIEAVQPVTNPLDVLAQQIVAMVALDDWPVERLWALVRQAAPFARLSRRLLDSVLDMLSGGSNAQDWDGLKPRLVWDRVADSLSRRRGSQRLAVTSGGTIPDRGLYPVFLADPTGAGRRVGELDEEMVFESRVGDIITLGSSSWRIRAITPDQVAVEPAPGAAARLPFWRGDGVGRPAELGLAIGAFVRQLGALDQAAARRRLTQAGLDQWAADGLITYLADQRAAVGALPDDRTIVLESCRDELGGWRVVLCSPLGGRVLTPWSLLIGASLRRRFGVDAQVMATDDGIVIRLPDQIDPDQIDPDQIDLDQLDPGQFGSGDPLGQAVGPPPSLLEHLICRPGQVTDQVARELANSSHFATRFRQCAARALLLPRPQPGKRQPLWQARNRSAQLLAQAADWPDFPIMAEAVRECLRDDFDVPALIDLMTRLELGQIDLVEVTTPQPSPFARSVMFGYVGLFMYDVDAPLADLRTAALTVDPDLLTDLLGAQGASDPVDLIDPAVLRRTVAELQGLTDRRQARDQEELVDLVRQLGPISTAELVRRTQPAVADQAPQWLAGLGRAGRLLELDWSGQRRWLVVEDAARASQLWPEQWRQAARPRLPASLTEPAPDPLADFLRRYARRHGPFTAEDCAAWLNLPVAAVRAGLERLAQAAQLTVGGADQAVRQYGDAEVMALLRRRCLAQLRAQVAPAPAAAYARFLIGWHGLDRPHPGPDAVLRAVEQLAGAVLPASALESLILPARVADYQPAWLDQLLSGGQVVWRGRGRVGADGWISLAPADWSGLGAEPTVAGPPLTELDRAVLTAFGSGGAYLLPQIAARLEAAAVDGPPISPGALLESVWRLVWAGSVTADTLAPLRARLAQGRPRHRTPARAPQPQWRRGPRLSLRSDRIAPAARMTQADAAGRWCLTAPGQAQAPVPSDRQRAQALLTQAEILLDRHGVLTRGGVLAESSPGGFAALYQVLRLAEDQGRLRRGYFIEGLSASQFASTAAVERLRAANQAAPEPTGPALVLSACDPANPYGAALPWPARPSPDDQAAQARPESDAVRADQDRPSRSPSECPPSAALRSGTFRGPRETEDSAHSSKSQAPNEASPGHQPARRGGGLVALASDGRLLGFVERGGHTVLTWDQSAEGLTALAEGLARTVRQGRLDGLRIDQIDGRPVLAQPHPLAEALAGAGFVLGPKGWRLR